MRKDKLMALSFGLLAMTATVKSAEAQTSDTLPSAMPLPSKITLPPEFQTVFGPMTGPGHYYQNVINIIFGTEEINENECLRVTAEAHTPGVLKAEDIKELKLFKRAGNHVTMTSLVRKGKDNWAVLVADAPNRNGRGPIDISAYIEHDWKPQMTRYHHGDWTTVPELKY